MAELVAPPMRICRKGYFTERDLTHAEAEAWHLRQAAGTVGKPLPQEHHLEEAFRNRVWGQRYGRGETPPPIRFKPRCLVVLAPCVMWAVAAVLWLVS